MTNTVTAKDLEEGFTFVKKGHGNHGDYFKIVAIHEDGMISYSPDHPWAFKQPEKIHVDVFLKNVLGRRTETRNERFARAEETDALIERTKESQSSAVLMDALLDAKAGKDIDALTKNLEEFVKAEREKARGEGYEICRRDAGYKD